MSKKHHSCLREAFGQFATGVTVVTTCTKQGEPVGMTVNSFSSVSLEPPLISWCVDKHTKHYVEFIEADYFVVNVLTEKQQKLSDLFASRSRDSSIFEQVSDSKNSHKIPKINDVSACFSCKTYAVYGGGDHTIVLGLVEDFEYKSKDPLLFFQSDYRSINKRSAKK